jgi:hypothetical protein
MAFNIDARRATARPLPPIAAAIREAMWLARRRADELDEAFLAHADARAVQGGAICEEAQEFRELKDRLAKLALDMEEMES